MGGTSSGRIFANRKKRVEDCLKIDILKFTCLNSVPFLAALKSNTDFSAIGLLKFSNNGIKIATIEYEVKCENGRAFIILKYEVRHANGAVPVKEKIEISSTVCKNGKIRFWFLCPLNDCHYRARIIYLPMDNNSLNSYFGCRKCYNLTYRVCQETKLSEALIGMISKMSGCSRQEVKDSIRANWKRLSVI